MFRRLDAPLLRSLPVQKPGELVQAARAGLISASSSGVPFSS